MDTASIVAYVNERTPAYFKTKPGLLKLWCLVFNLLAFGTNLIPFENKMHFTLRPSVEFDEVALGGFVITAILLALFYHHESDSEQQKLQWIKIEMYFCGLWAMLYSFVITLITIGNVVCLKLVAQPYECRPHIFATIFGFFAMLGYADDCLIKYREVTRRGMARTGTNLTTSPNTVVPHSGFVDTSDRVIMIH